MKYYVIGGQYQMTCYGATMNAADAKRLAVQHLALWDNWQGWHCPDVYYAADIISYDDPVQGTIYYPALGAVPRYKARVDQTTLRVTWYLIL